MHLWIRRRTFITGLAATTLAVPQILNAQPKRLRRLHILFGGANDRVGQTFVATLTGNLKDAGWAVGTNVLLEVRWASSNTELAEAYAKELVASDPDVILAHNTINVAALLRHTRTIPIVFVSVFDPIHSGFVTNMRRPGGNVTGFTNHESSMGGKWLELLKELAPHIDRVSLFYNTKTAPYAPTFYTHAFEPAARVLGIAAKVTTLHDPAEIEALVAELGRQGRSGLAGMADPFITLHRKRLIEAAARHRIPAVYPWPYFAIDGGLVSYGVDQNDIWRRAAAYLDRILRGEKPGDLPVQAPTKFQLDVNVRTAKALGLAIPPSLLVRADNLIE